MRKYLVIEISTQVSNPVLLLISSNKWIIWFAGIKTCFCPCGTLSDIASVATDRPVCK